MREGEFIDFVLHFCVSYMDLFCRLDFRKGFTRGKMCLILPMTESDRPEVTCEPWTPTGR